ncbi:MAG TPA: response regulator transcription factor [Verrucomicrobiae bacterium]|jgi:DNA-binding NarL/FixJ family response regulator|nr:response regulator transcription factor [Verrucomicrobiae bacterium]
MSKSPDPIPARIAIVEDDSAFRKEMTDLVNGQPNWRCVAACADSEESLRQVPGSHPDLVLLDIRLGRKSGLDIISRLKDRSPRTHIVILTVVDDPEEILRAMQLGACGYILKGGSHAELQAQIADSLQGGSIMSPAIARRIIQWVQQYQPLQPKSDYGLTERELEILGLAARGKQQGEIATLLSISKYTVRAHFRNTYEKLDVKSRAQAVLKAFGRGFPIEGS